MRKYLYMLLDKYILRQHEYITLEKTPYNNMVWNQLKVQGYKMYKNSVSHFIARREL